MMRVRSILVAFGLLAPGCSADPPSTVPDRGSSTTSEGQTSQQEPSSGTSSTDSLDSGETTIAATTTSGSDGSATSGDGSMTSGTDGSGSESTGETAECRHDEPPGNASGTLDWALTVGTQVRVDDLATDAMDNVLVTGGLVQADFGNGPIESVGSPVDGVAAADGYVAKYDPIGELLWVWVTGLSGPDTAHALVVDAAGDVIVGTNVDGQNLLKLDGATGAPLWAVAIADPVAGELDIMEMTIAPNGDVIATGFVNDGAWHFVLARIDGDGNTVWTRELVTTGGILDAGVQYTENGIAWLGQFTGTLELESGDLVATDSWGMGDLVLVRLDDDGNVEWGIAPAPSADDLYTTGFAADPCGGLYAYGSFRGTLDVGVDPLVKDGGDFDLFLVRFDGSGNPEWARQYGWSAAHGARRIAVDPQGSVILTGGIFQADFGAEHFEFDTYNGFMAMINREGDALWADVFESDWQTSDVAAVDSQGRVVVVGNYDTSVTIDGVEYEGGPSYENDLYLATFDF
jgi:hypothetical protein